jgi:hypothetical protein
MSPIKIVEIQETVDNWGRIEIYTRPEEILKILKDPESWSDDQWYISAERISYCIDDLIGLEVSVGEETFKVIEHE